LNSASSKRKINNKYEDDDSTNEETGDETPSTSYRNEAFVRDSNDMLILPALEEERIIWIALTRQIILDCQYLDSATEACRPVDCDPSLPHSDGVAESVLAILDNHFDGAFQKRLQCFRVSN
jgi:hypothetical protein